MALKTITGIVKKAKDIINSTNVKTFSGIDNRGSYTYHKLLDMKFSGTTIELLESDNSSYDFVVKDDPRLYIRIEWLQSLNIVVNWIEALIDSKVRVRNAIGESWVNAHFARYENSKIVVWANGKTSWTTTNIESYNFAALV